MAPSHLRLDAVGVFWACLAATWTLALAAGITFLLFKRDVQPLRIRGIPLSVCAVIMLHCYWVSVQLGYIVQDVTPSDSEYWIMGTWLPLGIALFHASNSRFLHVARAQKRFMPREEGEEKQQRQKADGSLIVRFRRMEHTNKVFLLVGAGMAFQILVTVLTYVISRKWHSSWGIPGTEVKGETETERVREMAKGWEWAPSVVWQFFWAWIVAPIILWQSRGIHDTQGWRVQTIGCCVAGLPATPMWLIALYVPGMEAVNQYLIPPQWIALSIMVLEIFTIFLPCWEVLCHEELQQKTLDSIAQWEAKNQFPNERAKSIISDTRTVESVTAPWWRSSANESILTMGALEHVLDRNPGPLLEFSVLRDFSGENIAFLTSVAEWKASFARAPASRMSMSREKSIEAAVGEHVTEVMLRERFNHALRIYVEYVSFPRATFPVNLPSQILKQLEAVFEAPARELYGVGRNSDLAVPFEAPDSWASSPISTAGDAAKATMMTMADDHGSEKSMMQRRDTPPQSLKFNDGSQIVYGGEVPAAFTTTIFDEAEASVKYLVLTNTWPKFVKERRSSMDSAIAV